MDKFKDEVNLLVDMLRRYERVSELYDETATRSKKILMSRNRGAFLYGRFLPDNDLIYIYGEDKGTLTKNASKANFKYYFDENDRIVLTERYNSDASELLNHIYYFYKEGYIEIVWYDLRHQQINRVSKIQYNGQRIQNVFEASFLPKNYLEDIYGLAYKLFFEEYAFAYKDGYLELTCETRTISRRGQVSGMDQRGNARVIDALVPLANMFGYVNTLRSMSQGRAQYTMVFSHYADVPQMVADEIKAKVAG